MVTRSTKPFIKPIYITRPIFPDLKEFTKELELVWRSKWLSNNGPKHQQFEKKIGRYLKVPYISLFNNGTTALLVAIKSLELSGEVITTPFTFPATPHCLTWNNLTPVFCDIDDVTMNINLDKIESLITKNTTAILAVHVFGTPCDVVGIQQIADKYNLKVIYDAAHAFGVEINNKPIGNFGDVSVFSFHPTKLFHSGEGGALAYKKKALKEQIDALKNFGIKNEEEVISCGINGKMNELQSILGLIVLKYIDKEIKKRKLLYRTYLQQLKGIKGITPMKHQANIKNSFQYFVIRVDKNQFGRSRDYVCEQFKKYNIYTRKYFYPLCSEYPHYKNLTSSRRSNLPVAHEVVEEVLSMPFYGGISVQDVENICNILKSFKK